MTATPLANQNDIDSFLKSVLSDAINERPPYGSISIKLFFHNGEIRRITSKKSESVIPTIQES